MRGGYSTSEMAALRNRCRVAQISVDDATFVQYTVRIMCSFTVASYLQAAGTHSNLCLVTPSGA